MALTSRVGRRVKEEGRGAGLLRPAELPAGRCSGQDHRGHQLRARPFARRWGSNAVGWLRRRVGPGVARLRGALLTISDAQVFASTPSFPPPPKKKILNISGELFFSSFTLDFYTDPSGQEPFLIRIIDLENQRQTIIFTPNHAQS